MLTQLQYSLLPQIPSLRVFLLRQDNLFLLSIGKLADFVKAVTGFAVKVDERVETGSSTKIPFIECTA